MNSRSMLLIAIAICGLAHGAEIENENTKVPVEGTSRTRNIPEEVDIVSLPAEARTTETSHKPQGLLTRPARQPAHQSQTRTQPIHAASPVKKQQHPAYQGPTYHHPSTGYQHPQRKHGGQPAAQAAPVYQSSQLGVSVSSYQPQNAGGADLLQHPKERNQDKKLIPALKNVKPAYYPKESSYATIPAQPKDIDHTPRFVANPSRNQIIENISPLELQQLTMQQHPQPFAVVQHPHGVHFSQYPGPGVNPYMMMPFNNHHQQDHESATVQYEETEHGFIDRVWGEVVSMRDSISDGFFETIPAMFRNMWDTIVGAVTSSGAARMLESVDWSEALQLVVRQLS